MSDDLNSTNDQASHSNGGDEYQGHTSLEDFIRAGKQSLEDGGQESPKPSSKPVHKNNNNPISQENESHKIVAGLNEKSNQEQSNQPVQENQGEPQKQENAKQVDPNFKPNFEYSVLDQKKEIPEQLRSIIVDEESEKFVRDLMERSDGLPIVKEKYQQTKQVLDTRTNFLKEVIERRESGDLHGAAKMLNFSEDDIIQLAINIAELRKATPEQQEAYKNYQDSLERGRQANKIISNHEEAARVQVLNNFDSMLATDYSKYSKAIPNFKNKVIAFAKAHFAEHNEDLAPKEAIEAYVREVLTPLGQNQNSQQNGSGSVARDRMNMPRSKHLNSTGAAPISQPIADIDQLRSKFRAMPKD